MRDGASAVRLPTFVRQLRGQSLRLGVAADGLALVRADRAGAATIVAQLPRQQRGDGAAVALGDDLAALFAAASAIDLRGWPLTVVLADELARLWQVAPPPACARLADLEAVAALRFQQLFGDSASAWQISAGWRLDAPFLAAAVPLSLLAAVQAGAAAHGLAIVAAAPHSVLMAARWRHAIGDGDWFGVLHDGVLTTGECVAGALTGLRAQALPAHPPAGWLDDHLAREALRMQRPAPARLLLCGAVPPAWQAVPGCVRIGAAPPTGWPAAATLAALDAHGSAA